MNAWEPATHHSELSVYESQPLLGACTYESQQLLEVTCSSILIHKFQRFAPHDDDQDFEFGLQINIASSEMLLIALMIDFHSEIFFIVAFRSISQ